MSTNPFSTPAPPGQGINWQELNGCLLLIEPIAFETGIKTVYDESDAVRANVYVLDGPKAGDEYENTLIFPKLLVAQTRPRVGEKVLGRLGQGAAKPGQSPPWLLQDATEQDQQVGVRWLNQRQSQSIAQPAQAQQQGGGWQQPPQQQPAAQGQQVPF